MHVLQTGNRTKTTLYTRLVDPDNGFDIVELADERLSELLLKLLKPGCPDAFVDVVYQLRIGGQTINSFPGSCHTNKLSVSLTNSERKAVSGTNLPPTQCA